MTFFLGMNMTFLDVILLVVSGVRTMNLAYITHCSYQLS